MILRRATLYVDLDSMMMILGDVFRGSGSLEIDTVLVYQRLRRQCSAMMVLFPNTRLLLHMRHGFYNVNMILGLHQAYQ
jgi:hypothetical protein